MDVRSADASDVPRMAAALAAAFAGDPPLRWLVPDDRRRPALLERYFRSLLPLYMERGRVWTSDDVACGAAWVAPGGWPFGARDQLRALPTLVRVFGRWPLRGVTGQWAAERGHPHEPHWFLDYIGVDPSSHGSGTGGALLEAMLGSPELAGSPAYLNAGSPRSRDLYRRHGFDVTEEYRLPLGGPPLWRMWRPAQPARAGGGAR